MEASTSKSALCQLTRNGYVRAGTAVVLLALGLMLTTSCLGRPHANVAACKSKPPNGTWLLDGFVPTSRDSPDLIRYARNLLFMTEVEDNFYIGTGRSGVRSLHLAVSCAGDWSGVYFLSDVLDLYNGTQTDFHVAAFFNQTTCVFFWNSFQSSSRSDVSGRA